MSTAHSLDQITAELAELRRLLTEQTDTILTVEEVRELTGLSKSAIYQKTCSRDGNPPELPHFKRGKRLYFKQSEIIQWMTAYRAKNRSKSTSLTRSTRRRRLNTNDTRHLSSSQAASWMMIAARFAIFLTEMITLHLKHS